jgi:hypothetical protein
MLLPALSIALTANTHGTCGGVVRFADSAGHHEASDEAPAPYGI